MPRRRAVDKSEITPGVMKRLIKHVFGLYGGRLSVVLVCIVLSSVASIIATMFMQKLIDECIVPGIANGFDSVKGRMITIITTMATIYALGVIAALIQSLIMATVGHGVMRSLRDKMFDNMQTLPIKYFDTHAHGDIMSTYTNDTDAIRQFIGNSLPQLITAVLSIVSIVCMMLYYSFWLTLAVGVVMMLMFRVVKVFGGKSAKYMMAQQKSLAKEEGFIEEMIQGQKVIKVFNHEGQTKEDFTKLNEQLFSDSNEANIAGNVLMPILGNMGNIMYVILAIIGAVLVSLAVPNLSFSTIFAGGASAFSVITIGVIVSFLSMSRQLSQTVGQMSMQVSMIAMAAAGASRIFALIDEESEQDAGYVMLVNAKVNGDTITETAEKTGTWAWKHYHRNSDTTTYTLLKGNVQMENVDFGYTPEKQVLFDVSLYAKPGQKIAFVGATGAGKTTITNLINRFYDIPDGKIRYDGININKIKKPDLRRSLGVVLQDVNLFTGTVMDNIRYGRLDATDEECIAAAKLANADSFITRLPDGYNTMLTGNGSQLSQGQRQLLSIARAAVADPPVMILDEATSSIDTRTEALVQEGMDNLMKGRTVFVIAHRLSTVRNSDAIMVLDHGHIIERGTHDELIAAKGTYYKLYTGAFELE